MNVLIITLGNSEIQFNEDRLGPFRLDNIDKNLSLTDGIISISVRKNIRNGKSQWLMPVSSREDGEVILRNYDVMKSIVNFPIVESLLDFIAENKIGKFYLVVTNQDDLIHRKGDTINYGYIIKKYFTEKLNLEDEKFTIIEITKNVRDIDYQYNNFKKILPELLGETGGDTEIRMHLFAQGGIDQINHALTLQLLRKYKSNVHVYQKAEDEELKEIHFPQLFLKDLNRQKIIKHLEDYDFGKAGELMIDDQESKTMAEYCAYRLSLNHNLIDQILLEDTYRFPWIELSDIEKKTIKLSDLAYAFKIDMHQSRYNDALTKLYTIYENIFKNTIDEITKTETNQFYDDTKKNQNDINENWEGFLKYHFGDNIKEKLKKKKKNLYINNPNARTYFYLCRIVVNDKSLYNIDFSEDDILKIDQILNNLRAMRNDINHTLGSATKEEIVHGICDAKSSYDEFINLLEKFTETKDYGIFEIIKNELLVKYRE